MIEVSTFRAYLDNAAAGQVSGNENHLKAQLAGMSMPWTRAAACCATTSGARRTKTPRGATSPSTPCTTTRRPGRGGLPQGIHDAKSACCA